MPPAQLHEKNSWPPSFKYEDWLNMPCIALRDYNGALQDTIPLKRGARGFVGKLGKKSDLVWFRVLPCDAVGGREEGWVPSRCVELGIERKYKHTVLTLEGQDLEKVHPVISLSRLSLDDKNASAFEKNCAAFLQAIVDERNGLRWIPEAAFAYISDRTSLALAKQIRKLIEKSSPKLMVILNSGNRFTAQDVRQACPTLKSSDNVPGIYLRYYDRFASDSKKLPALYVGQSVQMIVRMNDHEQNMKNPEKKAFHYIQARDAKTHEARLICKTEDRILLDLIEQVMVSLLECYAPFVKAKTKAGVEYQLTEDVLATDPEQGPFMVMKKEEFTEKDYTIQSRTMTHVGLFKSMTRRVLKADLL